MSKTIAVGVTGGIAAYKIVDLVSRLKKDEFEVVVIMTEGATKFVTPLTFRTISGREVLTDLWQETERYNVQHIGVAEEADLLVIAPATANFIGKMAHGIADDLLSTVALAVTCPILVVPAMNSNMYLNPIVQSNIEKLKSVGYHVMNPDQGILACGVSGPGRLPEVEVIYQKILDLLNPRQDFTGKRVLINAGATCEDIDPVRFITNRGTGKMGYCLAEEARRRGAEVILISGHTYLSPPPGVHFISVWSAEEMYQQMLQYHDSCDVIIGSAAVSDYKSSQVASQKRKKAEDRSEKWILELVGTPDILKELGKIKKDNQILVGFAAETENVLENARKKIASKNLDLIVANDVTVEGAGFATDTNIVTIIHRNGEVKSFPKMPKQQVAAVILDQVANLMDKSKCEE
ncbi:MAG TPA: bifunctional phosphopantothenoylcysteine decarboxylase/phosphopantothenate--cysteine ligase CoaBC [Syntrophomonadaceae bacterium]|nr:bifunctional phosphopantothenoylcysteine decarboxylase/phosphopantothenate--cysteine ligase CoaBC [Syntrophomonadaceae bacterium]HOQ08870.1 bifunctional phosphopantothenoylcysteine decarboxylase/phosphopantothenate--cysteine ligase CoaBC [Syntrophomonadaceae bacterium]HPU47681.1 bifunctional phosphopantothenoylcysteine decarboxylase/phosphopantothenate--cysteine ligase CoaBC [Syntrophomonadaceae bacterium]